MKLHFFVGNDDVERCKESFQLKTPIELGGADTLTGRLKSCTGIVLAVEPMYADGPGERWRVVIEAA